jgi:PAS domain S-box-containing protein
MIRWKKTRIFIENNGLVLISIAIILFYWAIDIIIEGRMVSRLMITISLLVYGISTQFLINKELAAKDLLRESEEQHRLMIEKLPVAILVYIKSKIVYVNPAFLMLFKLTSTDGIIGRSLLEFVPPELYDEIDKANRMMTETEVALPPLEVNIRRKDGAVITLVATPMPVTFDGQTAILGVLFDITERKSKEIELEKTHKLLQIQANEIENLKAKR